jgi:hypothetical protein
VFDWDDGCFFRPVEAQIMEDAKKEEALPQRKIGAPP